MRFRRAGIILLALLLSAVSALAEEPAPGFVADGAVPGQGTAGKPFRTAQAVLPEYRPDISVTDREPKSLSLSAPAEVNPYLPVSIDVTVPAAGSVRVTVASSVTSLRLRDPLPEYAAEAGSFSFPWKALTWGDEPIPAGRAVLTCSFAGGGKEQTVRREIVIRNPSAGLVYALPERNTYCPGKQPNLRIDYALANSGSMIMAVYRDDESREKVFQLQLNAPNDKNQVFRWNGKSNMGKPMTPGPYLMAFYAKKDPDRVLTHRLTLTDQREEAPQPYLYDPYAMPADGGDAAMWDFLMSPVWVLEGGEGGVKKMVSAPNGRAEKLGSVTCATTAVAVLDLSVPGWARIGAYRKEDGAYTEGWIRRAHLRYVRPSTGCALVLDKKTQRLTAWEDGHPVGTVSVSTGSVEVGGDPTAETRAGVFLTHNRMDPFRDEDRYRYRYVMRLDGGNLIHSIGSREAEGGHAMDYSDHLASLGRKASHGCIRVSLQADEENGGITAWWIWTHAAFGTKVYIIEGNE